MKKWLAISLLFLASMAFGQSVVITGTVLSPSGQPYSNGNGKAQLQPSNVQWLFGNSPVPSPITIASLDSFGRFSVTLTSTAVIQPQSQGPTWQFSFCSQVYASQTQPVCFTMTPMALTTSQDISTQIQAQSAPLPSSGGGITSLGLSVPQGLSVSPSSLSAPGTFAITWNGTPIPNSAIPDPTSSALGGVESITCTNQFLSAISTLGVPLCTTPSFVSLTTTGTSGAATLISGVLNIPQYTSSGGGAPGGSQYYIQTNGGSSAFGAITPNALPAFAVSEGPSSPPISQPKASYDVRDPQWGISCNNSADDTVGFNTLFSTIGSAQATIAVPVDATHPGPCKIDSLHVPANITLDFSGGGSWSLIPNPTAPGGGAFVSEASCTNAASTTCVSTLSSVTAGQTIEVVCQRYPGYTYLLNSVTDSVGDFFSPVQQSTPDYPTNISAWVASGSAGGSSVAVTATFTGTTNNSCKVWNISGLGLSVAADGAGAVTSYGTGTTMSSGSGTFLAGDFLTAYGGQGYTTETCTQGSGYTMPEPCVGTNQSIGAEYINNGGSGSLSATMGISAAPSNWAFALLGLRPSITTVIIEGGLIDPDLHQLFYNATGTNGQVLFTQNLAISRVYPEWWGASPASSAATNTPALEASIVGAFNNGSSAYNKTLDLGRGIYNINAETQWYNVEGNQASRFEVDCGSAGGINQTTANLRIMDSQSMSYGRFDNCAWSSSATDTLPTALLDIDWNGTTTPNGQKPQFIDFYSNSFVGNKLRAIGVLGAKSGGSAQFSNVNFYNPEFNGFTQAAFQIGTPTVGATNAIENFIWGGDMQGNNDYGVAVYSGNVEIIGTSMENGFSATTNEGAQTGYDMYCAQNQGNCIMEYVRSESMHLAACTTCIIKHSYTTDQGVFPVPGGTQPVGTIVDGHNEANAWDGRYYIVTADNGAFGGVGSTSTPVIASGGSGTTIVDTNENVAGSVTTKISLAGETVTQTGTGSTATLLNVPASIGTVAGSLGITLCTGLETMTQSSSGVTGVLQFPTPNNTGTPLTMNNFSGTALGTSGLTWTGGTSGCVWTQTSGPTFSATTMVITAATGSPNSSGAWTGGTSGFTFTPTAVPVAIAAWTTNQFVGMVVAVVGGTNAGCNGVVTANSAQTITLSAGWTTQYSLLNCSSPALSSTFIVEPNWGSAGTLYSCATGATSACAGSGMTFALVTGDGIGTCNGCSSNTVQAEDVSVPGLLWRISPSSGTHLKNVVVTMSNWLDTTGIGDPQQCCALDRDWDVRRSETIGLPLVGGNLAGTYYQTWSLPSTGGIPATAALQENLGTKQLTFTTGIVGNIANTGSNDVWVGGRSDPNCGTDITRCHLEVSPSIGPAAPYGKLNANGSPFTFVAGLSTGTGTPGSFQWYCGATGSSGSVPNGGGSSPSYCMTLGTSGLLLGAPTGGGEGAGTLNATGLYVNGVAVGGGGTGSQYQSAYFSNTNTVGAFGPGITGQVATSQGASSAPAYTSQGLGLGNGGSPVTASTYLVKCDSGTTILDRGTVLVFQSGASAITVPDTGNTGCGAGFAFKIIDDAAGTITISRQTSSTINIANGTTNSDGQTSFTMGNGAFATFSADGSGHYWVTLTQ